MPRDGTSLKPVNLHPGSGSQIDLSVPANKVQRQQAMVREFISVSHLNFYLLNHGSPTLFVGGPHWLSNKIMRAGLPNII
jgi:hypothetical protein